MLEDKVKKMVEEFRSLAEFHKNNAEDCHSRWRLNDAQMSINMYHNYSHFSDKLEGLLE